MCVGFFMFYSYVQTSEYVTNCFVWQNVMDKNIKLIKLFGISKYPGHILY